MRSGTYIAFYMGMALYMVAGFQACVYLAKGNRRRMAAGTSLAMAGGWLLIIVFALRWTTWGRLPLTTTVDALDLFIMLTTAITVWMARRPSMGVLPSVCLPPLALVCLVNIVGGSADLVAEPRELAGLPLVAHVGLAFLAYALFFVASMTSLAYVFQSQRLKRRNTTGLFQRLPSLEQLDRTLVKLVGYGYISFSATLIVGIAWAFYQEELLSEQWWLSPKVILSFVMVVFYAVIYHGRRSGRLRGPKPAYLFSLGFLAYLGVFLVLSLMNLSNYNFWGSGS